VQSQIVRALALGLGALLRAEIAVGARALTPDRPRVGGGPHPLAALAAVRDPLARLDERLKGDSKGDDSDS